MSPDRTPLLTVGEVADRLQVGVETVRRYIKRGDLDAVQLVREYRIEPAALETFLARRSA